MLEKQQSHLIADLNLFGAAMIWGVNVVAMKFAISTLNPFYFNALRFVFSVLILAIWLRFSNRAGRPKSEIAIGRRRYATTIGLYAMLFGVVYQVAFLMGIFRTSATNTALIMSTVPMWTALIAMMFLKERLSGVSWAGLLVTFVGTMIVTLDKPSVESATSTFWGNAIMLFCAISWAVSTVVSRPVLKSISPVELSFLGMGLALPIHILLAVLAPVEDVALQRQVLLQPSVIAATLYSGIFSTGIALAMWSFGVKWLGASHAAIYSNLIPLVALLLGWMWLNEVPTVYQLMGGLMIVCGLLVMRRG